MTRRRKVIEADQSVKCRDCQSTVGPWYWFGMKGDKLACPRCETCHARKARQQKESKEGAAMYFDGYWIKVCGKHERGVYHYWEPNADRR
jgi:hypothetical protein